MMMNKKKKNNYVIMSTREQDHHLSEDLILEILSYLPPITLVRFKSVSKTWYSLFSNPDFCRRNTANYQLHSSSNRNHNHDHHMLEEPSPPGIILLRRRICFEDSNIVFYPYPREIDHAQKKLALLLNDYGQAAVNEWFSRPTTKKETFMLADSCNGLLLYVHEFTRKEEEKEKRETVFYVCNPITKHSIKLPTIDDEETKLYECYNIAQIVFNPSFSLTYKVFAWIPCLKRSTTTSSSECFYNYYPRLYVYSSEARSWKLSISIPILKELCLFFIVDSKAVLWNGVLHWTPSGGGRSIDDFILCYDIEKETVWKMKFPKMATGYTNRRLFYFGLCGERLLMIEEQYSNNHGYGHGRYFPSSFDVLEKQEQNGDKNETADDMWTVRYRVNFQEVDNDFYSNYVFDVSILDIYRSMRTKNEEEEEEEEEVMLMKVGSNNIMKIIFFNLTSNTFGNEILRNIETVQQDFDFLIKYTTTLHYNVTLFPP